MKYTTVNTFYKHMHLTRRVYATRCGLVQLLASIPQLALLDAISSTHHCRLFEAGHAMRPQWLGERRLRPIPTASLF